MFLDIQHTIQEICNELAPDGGEHLSNSLKIFFHRAVRVFISQKYLFYSESFDRLYPPPPPPPPGTFYDNEIEEQTSYFWKHLTISRDETAASSFQKELLSVLFLALDSPAKDNRRSSAELISTHTLPIKSKSTHSYFNSGNVLPTVQDRSISQKPAIERIHDSKEATSSPAYMMSSKNESPGMQIPPTNIKPIPQNNTIDSIDGGSVRDLLNRISLLETENDQLKEGSEENIEVEVIYFIHESPRDVIAYLDEPTWTFGLRGKVALKSHFPIPDVEGYLQQKRNVAFYIAKSYNQEHQKEDVQRASREKRELPRPEPIAETIRLESQPMIEAMEAFVRARPNFQEDFPGFDVHIPFAAPYLFWYHNRAPDALEGLGDGHYRYMAKLSQWINDKYGSMYSRVSEQLERGVVSHESVEFLMKPGDVIVVNDGGDLNACVAANWANSTTPRLVVESQKTMPGTSSRRKGGKLFQWKWRLNCWSWKYDGSFYKKFEDVEIELETENIDGEIDIRKLSAYPLKYATSEVTRILEKRGMTFWSCRDKRLVSYEDRNGLYGVRGIPTIGPWSSLTVTRVQNVSWLTLIHILNCIRTPPLSIVDISTSMTP